MKAGPIVPLYVFHCSRVAARVAYRSGSSSHANHKTFQTQKYALFDSGERDPWSRIKRGSSPNVIRCISYMKERLTIWIMRFIDEQKRKGKRFGFATRTRSYRFSSLTKHCTRANAPARKWQSICMRNENVIEVTKHDVNMTILWIYNIINIKTTFGVASSANECTNGERSEQTRTKTCIITYVLCSKTRGDTLTLYI